MTNVRLSPPDLIADGQEGQGVRAQLTLSSPIRALRSFFLDRATPAPHLARPTAERKWMVELALVNSGSASYAAARGMDMDEMVAAAAARPGPHPRLQQQLLAATKHEWEKRWMEINRLQVAGPIRSFIFKLTHRRLHLLSQPWLAAHYGRQDRCLLCDTNHSETYSHVFSDCTFASNLWSSLNLLQDALKMDLTSDPRPARLVGDLSIFSVQGIISSWRAQHPPPPPPPKTVKVEKWLRRTWGEVRAMVLKSIWEARCDLLHHNTETQPAAAASALSKLRSRISALAYTRLPSTLVALRHERLAPPTVAEEGLNRLIWGRVAHQLLHPRHREGGDGDH